jgi:hypothetical protein
MSLLAGFRAGGLEVAAIVLQSPRAAADYADYCAVGSRRIRSRPRGRPLFGCGLRCRRTAGLDISYNVRSTLLLVPNCHRSLAFSPSHGYARHADGYSFDERRRVPPEVADPSEREHEHPVAGPCQRF